MGRPVPVVPLILFAVMLMGTGAKNVRCISFFSATNRILQMFLLQFSQQ